VVVEDVRRADEQLGQIGGPTQHPKGLEYFVANRLIGSYLTDPHFEKNGDGGSLLFDEGEEVEFGILTCCSADLGFGRGSCSFCSTSDLLLLSRRNVLIQDTI